MNKNFRMKFTANPTNLKAPSGRSFTEKCCSIIQTPTSSAKPAKILK